MYCVCLCVCVYVCVCIYVYIYMFGRVCFLPSRSERVHRILLGLLDKYEYYIYIYICICICMYKRINADMYMCLYRHVMSLG